MDLRSHAPGLRGSGHQHAGPGMRHRHKMLSQDAGAPRGSAIGDIGCRNSRASQHGSACRQSCAPRRPRARLGPSSGIPSQVSTRTLQPARSAAMRCRRRRASNGVRRVRPRTRRMGAATPGEKKPRVRPGVLCWGGHSPCCGAAPAPSASGRGYARRQLQQISRRRHHAMTTLNIPGGNLTGQA